MFFPRFLITLALFALLVGCAPLHLYLDSAGSAFDPAHHERVRQKAARQQKGALCGTSAC